MNIPSETVQSAQRLLAEREALGLRKYGTTVDRTDLTPEQWLQHLIEELSDGLLYALRARQTMRPAEQLLAELKESAQAAFITSESCGQTAEYRHVFKFRTLAELQAFGRAWASVVSMQATPVTDFNLYTSPDAWTGQPAPAEAPECRKAPWPDYAGNPIFEGDVIVHPSGTRARVVFDPSATHSPGWSEWRCDYAGDPSSYALAHQIGDLGRAVVERPATAPEDAERAAYLARWKDAPEWADWLSESAHGVCKWHKRKPELVMGAWTAGEQSMQDAHDLLGSVRCEPRPQPAVAHEVTQPSQDESIAKELAMLREVLKRARAVGAYDWSDNDDDAVITITRLADAVERYESRFGPEPRHQVQP